MWTLLSFLWRFFPLLLCARELEVALETRSPLKPVYVSRLYTPPSEYDWRYFDELRNVLEFDFGASGFFSLFPKRDELEDAFHFPDARAHFDLAPFRKEKIAYAVAIQVFQNRFSAAAFNLEKGTSKKYPEFPLTGRIEEDRVRIHRLYDAIQKDFVGIEGIASCRILYAQRVKNEGKGADWISEIWICDSDGVNSRQLTHEKSYCLSPGFLPNSSASDPAFFYVSEKIGQSKIYAASLSRSGVKEEAKRLVDLRGNQALPSISAKGSQLAFITDVAGRPDLFVQNFDPKGNPVGKARQIYTSARATQASPTFSPDGKRIAFVSDKDGPPRIYVMPIPDPKETRRLPPRLLTKKNRENTSPAWSPDGTKLAYSATVDGVRQIWVYDFATEEETQLTSGPEKKENPSWAPDSFHLLYNTETNDASDLYLIDLNSRTPLQITKGPGQKRFPAWERK